MPRSNRKAADLLMMPLRWLTSRSRTRASSTDRLGRIASIECTVTVIISSKQSLTTHNQKSSF
jgi:hypothetical protein